jgi:hypothetical protein
MSLSLAGENFARVDRPPRKDASPRPRCVADAESRRRRPWQLDRKIPEARLMRKRLMTDRRRTPLDRRARRPLLPTACATTCLRLAKADAASASHLLAGPPKLAWRNR